MLAESPLRSVDADSQPPALDQPARPGQVDQRRTGCDARAGPMLRGGQRHAPPYRITGMTVMVIDSVSTGSPSTMSVPEMKYVPGRSNRTRANTPSSSAVNSPPVDAHWTSEERPARLALRVATVTISPAYTRCELALIVN